VTVLVMQADKTFWNSLVFNGIDDVDVDSVTAAFGTVDVTARGRAASAACPAPLPDAQRKGMPAPTPVAPPLLEYM
jgi:hypothetical protein